MTSVSECVLGPELGIGIAVLVKAEVTAGKVDNMPDSSF